MSSYEENPTRHAAHIRALDAAEHRRREDLIDLHFWAKRHGYQIRYRPTGTGELIPIAVRPGDSDEVGYTSVPGSTRR